MPKVDSWGGALDVQHYGCVMPATGLRTSRPREMVWKHAGGLAEIFHQLARNNEYGGKDFYGR